MASGTGIVRLRLVQILAARLDADHCRNAERGRYDLLRLRRRVYGCDLPSVQVVDIRTEVPETKSPALFSRRRGAELGQGLGNKEQAI